jgi:hypothetical protein
MIWLPIIGALIAIITAIAGIVAFVSILEMLKLAALAFLIPFMFLWLWAFFKKTFGLEQYISAALSLVIVVFLAYAVYTSWFYIVLLGMIVIIGWVAMKFIFREPVLSLIRELLAKKEK